MHQTVCPFLTTHYIYSIEKIFKKISRNFEKVLDKGEMMWYNSQAVRERIANGH